MRVAIQEGGRKPQEILETLRVEKRFANRMLPVEFSRTKPDVLDLVMEGDEEVRWEEN